MASRTALPRQTKNVTAWIVIFLLAMLAWIPTVQQSLQMPPMPGTMGMTLASFLIFWTLMMAAMMLPALAPMVSLHLEVCNDGTPGPLLAVRSGIFILGYLLIWTVFGIPAFLLALLNGYLVSTAPLVAVGEDVALLVGIGLYQFTPLKAYCLAHHHAPLRKQLLAQRSQPIFDFWTGFQHGIYCLGSCGTLMLIMVVGGVMNLYWMLAIAVIIFLEKVWSHSKQLSVLVGIGLVFLGILAAFQPMLLPGLSIASTR